MDKTCLNCKHYEVDLHQEPCVQCRIIDFGSRTTIVRKNWTPKEGIAPEPIQNPYTERIINRINKQTFKGVKKYGATMKDNPLNLSVDQVVEYALEECADLMVYLENVAERLVKFTDYQIETARTDNNKNQKDALNNFALGIAGEAGEIIDLVKKVLYHGHEVDKEKFKLELGDQLWYIARIAAWVGLTLDEIALANIEKLKQRYPDGFDKERSINRDEH